MKNYLETFYTRVLHFYLGIFTHKIYVHIFASLSALKKTILVNEKANLAVLSFVFAQIFLKKKCMTYTSINNVWRAVCFSFSPNMSIF